MATVQDGVLIRIKPRSYVRVNNKVVTGGSIVRVSEAQAARWCSRESGVAVRVSESQQPTA